MADVTLHAQAYQDLLDSLREASDKLATVDAAAQAMSDVPVSHSPPRMAVDRALWIARRAGGIRVEP